MVSSYHNQLSNTVEAQFAALTALTSPKARGGLSWDYPNSDEGSSILLTFAPSKRSFTSSKLACMKQAPSLLTEPGLYSKLMYQEGVKDLSQKRFNI
jgi:hypothetical protein